MKSVAIFLVLFICSLLVSQVPDYEFITQPTDLIQNYFDFMPGSYYSSSVQVETDGSVYVVFQAQEFENSNKRIYYAYLNSSGVVQQLDFVGSQDVWEGYPGIDLDPVSGDPLVVWQADYVVGTYDQYQLNNVGNWMEPFVIIDDNIPLPTGGNEFIMPEVHIGPSPFAGKRRFYVIGRNYAFSGNPTVNLVICYTDLDEDDLANQIIPDWTYSTIPVLNSWNPGNTDWAKPYYSFAVSDDGKIAFFGYVSTSSGNDSLFVFVNDNYGVGDYQYYSQDAHYVVELQNQEYYFGPLFSNHFSTVFSDVDKLETQFNLGLQSNDGQGNYYFYPEQIFPYIFQYDIQTHEFHYKIANSSINENAANPNYEWGYDQIYLPWDTDNDGQIDEYNPAGEVVMMKGWPIYYYEDDSAFQDNLSQIAVNKEKGWLAHVWQDGLKARLAAQAVPGFDDWADTPEIAICISADNGNSWSKPLFLNANETPELTAMIPEYVYVGDKIEDLGNNHGKLHLFFLDDNDFGNNASLGMLKYCSLDIDFSPFASVSEIISPSQIELSNYPNPFNPHTTISFTLNSELNETFHLEIYNIKAQKIKTLPVEIPQNHTVSVVWNGTDDQNKPVASGVYFAKLQAGSLITTRKMLLIK
jgi:hypothetical protein